MVIDPSNVHGYRQGVRSRHPASGRLLMLSLTLSSVPGPLTRPEEHVLQPPEITTARPNPWHLFPGSGSA